VDQRHLTYEDPEKAAAEPTLARTATAENFMIELFTEEGFFYALI
jgi:hypothetical protein